MTEKDLINQWAKSAKLLFENYDDDFNNDLNNTHTHQRPRNYGDVDYFTDCLNDTISSDLDSIMWKKLNSFVSQKNLAFIIKYFNDRRNIRITDDLNILLSDIDTKLFKIGFTRSDVTKFMREQHYGDIGDTALTKYELEQYDLAKQHITELAASEFTKQFEEACRKTHNFKNILKKDFDYMPLIHFELYLPFEITIINPAVEGRDRIKNYEEII